MEIFLQRVLVTSGFGDQTSTQRYDFKNFLNTLIFCNTTRRDVSMKYKVKLLPLAH